MKIGIFLASGFEEVEAITSIDILRRAELDLEIISINADRLVKGSHGIVVQSDNTIEEIDIDALNMLILPGGMPGTTNLGKCKKLTEAIRKFDSNSKWIGAICAAPSVLEELGVLEGRVASIYPTMKDMLISSMYSPLGTTVDNHIITSSGVGTAIDFGLTIVENLCGKEKAEEISNNILYRRD